MLPSPASGKTRSTSGWSASSATRTGWSQREQQEIMFQIMDYVAAHGLNYPIPTSP
jgi:hypothetical protein